MKRTSSSILAPQSSARAACRLAAAPSSARRSASGAELDERRGERVGVAGGDEARAGRGGDEVGHVGKVAHDHGETRGRVLRDLERREVEVVGGRVGGDADVGRVEQGRDVLRRDEAGERDLLADAGETPLERRPLGSVADDQQAQRRLRGRGPDERVRERLGAVPRLERADERHRAGVVGEAELDAPRRPLTVGRKARDVDPVRQVEDRRRRAAQRGHPFAQGARHDDHAVRLPERPLLEGERLGEPGEAAMATRLFGQRRVHLHDVARAAPVGEPTARAREQREPLEDDVGWEPFEDRVAMPVDPLAGRVVPFVPPRVAGVDHHHVGVASAAARSGRRDPHLVPRGPESRHDGADVDRRALAAVERDPRIGDEVQEPHSSRSGGTPGPPVSNTLPEISSNEPSLARSRRLPLELLSVRSVLVALFSIPSAEQSFTVLSETE